MRPLYSTKIKFINIIYILCITFFFTSSCEITTVPNTDTAIKDQIELSEKQISKFYLKMLETTSESGDSREYENFIMDYIDIRIELNSLLNKNRIDPLNNNSIKICEITLKLWEKYKEEHKKSNTISNKSIEEKLQNFNSLFLSMQVATKGAKIISNPPK